MAASEESIIKGPNRMDYVISLRGREFAAFWERCAERWIKKGNDLTAKRSVS